MADITGIQWASHTWSPWVGCTKLSPACDHCYAAGWAKRTGQTELWNGERRRTTPAYWRNAVKLDRAAAHAGARRRIFPSLCDPFDNQVPEEWRDDMWSLIRETPHLDWLLLTKRPQNIRKMLPPDWIIGYDNVWLGTTAEDAKHYRQRWNHLAAIPSRVRFLSYEPALGPIGILDLGRVGAPEWVIVGGESGVGCRPFYADWARDVLHQCRAAGVPFFMKQMSGVTKSRMPPIPDDLMIREFPREANDG